MTDHVCGDRGEERVTIPDRCGWMPMALGWWLLLAFAQAGASVAAGDVPDRPVVEGSAQAGSYLLTERHRQYLIQRGPLRLCVDPDWLPFEAINPAGVYIGIGADFMALLARRGGLQLELVPTRSWSESLTRIRDRDCDVLPLAMKTPSRSEYLDFTRPYLETPSVIATLGPQPFIRDLAEVADRPLGIMAGFSFVEIYRARYPGIHLVEVSSYEEGLTAVMEGELFGMLGNMASIAYSLQRMRNTELRISGRLIDDSRLSMASRNDEPVLNEILEILVATISAGDRQRVLNQWYAVRIDMDENGPILFPLVLVAGLLSILLIFWAYHLYLRNSMLRQSNARLLQQNRQDALTGTFNRLYFDERLQHAMALARRRRLKLAVAMLDLDHFKQFNDHHGHALGDQCLRQISGLMRDMFQRETETVARYGGEEFVILSEDGSPEQFARRLEAFRQALKDMPLQYEGEDIQLTVSIGLWVAVPSIGDRPADFMRQADDVLYEAKAAGRDCLRRREREESVSTGY
ncbi:diguanylate cyclase domain-containing protein [Natronospira bacteriovora]|uniref:diguanylate cyclase n=1 Tax=Natronospira bacteriovora TaxID=3069753 RepID=A0ABU0W7N1_9GAMM|nr:diguanylate cyclase [Natronospira sp. AB-CW4]MDQ2070046.1 diguanylate cyclase [Natronospira sp. AB-CW4]